MAKRMISGEIVTSPAGMPRQGNAPTVKAMAGDSENESNQMLRNRMKHGFQTSAERAYAVRYAVEAALNRQFGGMSRNADRPLAW
jgi:hypothetical protein